MSIFQRFFGGAKKDENISSAEAIQRLSNVEDTLIKKQEFLESQIEAEKTNAVRYSKQGNKRAALLALKKKKKHENTLKQVDGTLTTLEIQRESLQNASSNMEVLRAMKVAAGAIKKSNDNLGIDDVHNLMDDLDEQNQIAKEIATAISTPVGVSDTYDDADLERELEELAQDELKQDMINIGPLPDVPTTTIKTKEQHDELRELEAWAT